MAGVGINMLQVWDDIVPFGSNTLLLSTTPVLWAWNNKIGCYQNFTVGAGFYCNIFYDKSFFRKRLGTFWKWSFSTVSFSSFFGTGHLNNKVSSHLTL